MFSHQRVRSALLSTFAVFLMLLISAGVPGGVSQATSASTSGGPILAAAPCNLATAFNASNFPSTPNVNNTWLPYVPGTEFVLDGRVNVGGQPLAHQVILIVTDLTKVVHGVRTVVLWDRDFNTGTLTEAELAFHTQDNAGNVWNLGEYPAQYSGGQFTGAPDTWISGLASAQGGMIIPGNPQAGTAVFLQAYAPGVIGDCGQVSTVGVQNPALCVPVGCYDNVLVVDETSPPELGTQKKYYAPGVGNFQIGATDNDPQGETLVLSETVHLGRDACIAARQAALALEAQANQVSPNIYGKTTAMQQTGFCETIQATPTPSVSPTPTTTPTATPTATPPPEGSKTVFLPITAKNIIGSLPPPAIYDGCKSDPNPGGAANFPIRIVKVNKVAEVVTLQNVGSATISLEDWNLCSINGNQDHDQIFGTIAPGQTRSFPNTGDPNIWSDNQRDDAALYNAAGFLVSYWADQ